MFRNYLDHRAAQHSSGTSSTAFINIAGLAVGLACAILIILFVRDELSYDKWIAGSENLWRVEVTIPCAWPFRPDHNGANHHAAAGRDA